MSQRASSSSSELVGGVGAQEELGLQPHRAVVAGELPVVEVVLEAELGELGRVEGQVGRDAEAVGAVGVRTEASPVAAHPVAAQPGHPALCEAVNELRVEAPVEERL